ncbi:MAG: glycerate kinase [Thermotogae bacterium]|nr:glycerate kinase [Thermotogota bacterium]
MKILVAPDSFKGSLTAAQFCEIAEKTANKVDKSIEIIKMPLADGGEGTTEAFVINTGGSLKYTYVKDPSGNTIKAFYGILGDGKTAVIEMAQASGLPLVKKENRNPWNLTTYGTGEMIKDALDNNISKIIIGIGGSATNDGGAGAMQALGFELLDGNGKDIVYGAEGLSELKIIKTENHDRRIDFTEFIIACDVNNKLYGENGASFVYGPQKGADRETVIKMDKAMINYSEMIKKYLGKDVSEIPGSGAAGGLGAGIMAFLNGKPESGFDIIKRELGLKNIFENNNIDLVITGEGEINYQSVNGKLPVEISKLAKEYGVPSVVITGNMGREYNKAYEKGVSAVFSITSGPMELEYAMKNTSALLENILENILRLYITK